ncbi:xylitol dehydrogenase [Moniliophthora roreri]|uniref:Putative GroES-like protein n=1 Tax=Moniliophthora roreri TaxID=221103 RepID=A0A0W0FI87_MONRR|nr:xylitol dehydrogenase [Moniliophthora roreri]
MSPVVLPSLPSQSAAVLYGPRDLRLESRVLFPPHQGECQVKVLATGLCGSDLHYFLAGRNGDFAVQAPLVLGHEAAGVITAVGPGVATTYPNLKVGTRVAIEAGVMCKNCKHCSEERYNLCKNMRFCSSAKTFPHLDGTLQEKMNHPAHVLHPLPDNVSFDQAALAEPLSVLLHASRRAGVCPSTITPSLSLPFKLASSPSPASVFPSPTASPGPNSSAKRVLVLGVGAIGLLACALARSVGVTRICAVDINQNRLDFATQEGFVDKDGAFCLPLPPTKATGKEKEDPMVALNRSKRYALAALEKFGEPDGFDVVYECTGAESCIQIAVHTALTGGKIALVGMGTPNVHLPLAAAALREVDLIGSFRYANTYPEALRLLSASSANSHWDLGQKVSRLVTHRFGLVDTKRAFEVLAKGRDENGGVVLKIVIGSGQV